MMPASPATLPQRALEDVTDEVWGLPEIESFTVRAVETVLRRRGVDMDEMKRPNMEIAVPAIEAMRYSPLRDEIATLIASSMDGATESVAHPAFLTILKQVTRDEVRILQKLPPPEQFVPVANVYVTTSRDQVRLLQRNVVPGELVEVCEHADRMAGYIDNLIRLQLLHEPEGMPLPDASFYSALMKQEACQAVLRDRNVRRRSRIEKRILAVTDFGESFRQVCLR
ncbi:MAG: DUF4393 domain-containing protein [Pseudomonadota bacterium]